MSIYDAIPDTPKEPTSLPTGPFIKSPQLNDFYNRIKSGERHTRTEWAEMLFGEVTQQGLVRISNMLYAIKKSGLGAINSSIQDGALVFVGSEPTQGELRAQKAAENRAAGKLTRSRKKKAEQPNEGLNLLEPVRVTPTPKQPPKKKTEPEGEPSLSPTDFLEKRVRGLRNVLIYRMEKDPAFVMEAIARIDNLTMEILTSV